MITIILGNQRREKATRNWNSRRRYDDRQCNCKIIGPALDHMSNDKQGRNNLIRIAARRGGVSMRNHTGRYFGDWRAIQTDFRGSGRAGGWKATWKHVSRRVACLSRLITRNALTGRFVVTYRETRYWNFTSLARELLRSCVIYALSRTLISAPTLSFPYCSDGKSS